MYSLKISKSVNHNYNIMQTPLRYKSSSRLHKSLWHDYQFKLNNNLSRAKSQIFNITSYNKFEYFFTQTIDPIYARTDLQALIKKFNLITRQLRYKYRTLNLEFYYLLIPEYHSDGKSWHLHGFLSSGFSIDLYKNINGFESLKTFEKIGFNSVSKIRNYSACCKYITKYITKSSFLNLGKGDKLYYCSQGLKRDNPILKLATTQIAPIHFDFKSEYVFKTSVNQQKIERLMKDIQSNVRFQYYAN